MQDQVKNLNRALRQAQFGTDSYQFRVDRNPDYAEYYDMIMAPELMEGDITLFSAQFQEKFLSNVQLTYTDSIFTCSKASRKCH